MVLASLCTRKAIRANSTSAGLSSTRRISPSSWVIANKLSQNIFIVLAVAGCRQGKKERCAFVHFGFRPDLPAVLLDDAMNGGEPYSGPFEIFCAMEPLEDAEKFVRILLLKPGAVIANEDKDRKSVV